MISNVVRKELFPEVSVVQLLYSQPAGEVREKVDVIPRQLSDVAMLDQ